jgi:hypothetical protein
MERQFNERTEQYLSRFYEPSVTAYEFLKCFFAYLKKFKLEKVNRDLVGFLYRQKKITENQEVLAEIKFRTNGINYYSNDLEDALFNLQNGGLLGKMNPSFGIILIHYTDDEIKKILESTKAEYRDIIKKIAESYVEDLKNTMI